MKLKILDFMNLPKEMDGYLNIKIDNIRMIYFFCENMCECYNIINISNMKIKDIYIIYF